MNIRLTQASLLAASLTLFFTGCADLGAIKDYAAISTNATAYTDLTREWAHSAARQEIDAVDQDEVDGFREEAKSRARQQKGLLELHAGLSGYMAVLGKLAGDDIVSNGDTITGLASAVQKAAGDRITAADVNAASALADVVATAVKDSIRQRALRSLIRDGNAPVQKLTRLMRNFVSKDFKKSFVREIESIDDSFVGFEAIAKTPEQRLNPALKLLRERDYERKQTLLVKVSQCDAYDQTLANIAAGHQELFNNLDKLSKKELKQTISTYKDKVKTLFNAIKALN